MATPDPWMRVAAERIERVLNDATGEALGGESPMSDKRAIVRHAFANIIAAAFAEHCKTLIDRSPPTPADIKWAREGSKAHDLSELIPELAACDDPKVFSEIVQTMREIVFPETIGELRVRKAK